MVTISQGWGRGGAEGLEDGMNMEERNRFCILFSGGPL